MSKRRVVIIGLGIISPVGNDVATALKNIVEGKSGIGPVTHFGSLLVRPHDLDLAHEISDGALQATVVRVTRLGFQTVVDLDVQGAPLYAQLAREATDRLTLSPGASVYVSHARGESVPTVPGVPVDVAVGVPAGSEGDLG